MKQDAQLQTISIENINAEAAIKKPSGDDFNGSSFIWMGLIILFFVYMFHSGGGASNTQSSQSVKQNKKGIKFDDIEKKLFDKVRSLEMTLKNLALKKREAEGEIRKVEMNSLSNLDAESGYENELKIDKLRMKIEEIEVMEEKKTDELENTKTELEKYQNENYL